jgi:hypothetical protein
MKLDSPYHKPKKVQPDGEMTQRNIHFSEATVLRVEDSKLDRSHMPEEDFAVPEKVLAQMENYMQQQQNQSSINYDKSFLINLEQVEYFSEDQGNPINVINNDKISKKDIISVPSTPKEIIETPNLVFSSIKS